MTGTVEGDIAIKSESDIVAVRRVAREAATKAGFGMTDVTRVVTASSELARNIFHYAGSGTMRWKTLNSGIRFGVEFVFEDQGPGIPNIELAMQEGYTTGGGMGLGLPGTKRLVDEMEIRSSPGKGTIVTIRKWKR